VSHPSGGEKASVASDPSVRSKRSIFQSIRHRKTRRLYLLDQVARRKSIQSVRIGTQRNKTCVSTRGGAGWEIHSLSVSGLGQIDGESLRQSVA
jgi:hypothetical protein